MLVRVCFPSVLLFNIAHFKENKACKYLLSQGLGVHNPPCPQHTHTCSKPAGRLMQFKAVHHHRLKQEEECSLMLNKSLCLLLKGRLRVINLLPHTVNACVRYKQPDIV